MSPKKVSIPSTSSTNNSQSFNFSNDESFSMEKRKREEDPFPFDTNKVKSMDLGSLSNTSMTLESDESFNVIEKGEMEDDNNESDEEIKVTKRKKNNSNVSDKEVIGLQKSNGSWILEDLIPILSWDKNLVESKKSLFRYHPLDHSPSALLLGEKF